MFSQAKKFFGGIDSLTVDAQGRPASKDLQIAATLLLIECAKGDKDFTQVESETIVRTISETFGLNIEKTAVLFEESQGKEASWFQAAIDQLKQEFDQSQKQLIMALVWKVIAADGRVDKFESHYARIMREKLGLTLEQAIRARTIAEDGVNLTLETDDIHFAQSKSKN